MAQGQAFQIDIGLTNFAQGVWHDPRRYHAPGLLPPVPVDRESFKYLTFTADGVVARSASAQQSLERAPGTPFKKVTTSGSEASGVIKTYGAEAVMDIQQGDNATADIRRQKARAATVAVIGDYEVSCATLLTTAANYTNTTDLSASGEKHWDDEDANILEKIQDTVSDIRVAMFGTPARIKMVMSRSIRNKLRHNPYIRDWFKSTGNSDPQRMNTDALREYFEVIDDLVVFDTVVNNAGKGESPSGAYAWGNFCSLVAVPDLSGGDPPDQETNMFAAAFQLRLPDSFTGAPSSVGPLIDTYVNDQTIERAFRCRHRRLLQVVNADAGHLFTNVLSS